MTARRLLQRGAAARRLLEGGRAIALRRPRADEERNREGGARATATAEPGKARQGTAAVTSSPVEQQQTPRDAHDKPQNGRNAQSAEQGKQGFSLRLAEDTRHAAQHAARPRAHARAWPACNPQRASRSAAHPHVRAVHAQCALPQHASRGVAAACHVLATKIEIRHPRATSNEPQDRSHNTVGQTLLRDRRSAGDTPRTSLWHPHQQ